MGQSVRWRRQPIVSFTANSRETITLGRGSIYRELRLFLNQAPTVTAGNNSAANTVRGDDWNIIQRLRVIANGTDVLVDVDGVGLWWWNFFWYGVNPGPPVNADGAVQLGDGATANPILKNGLILPLWMPRSVRPIDTALDSRKLASLQIEIQWGTFTDVNSAATAYTTEPTLEVWSMESFGLSRESRFAQWRRWQITQAITATNPRLEVDLPTGDVYRGFLINTTDAGVDVGDIINEIKVKSGSVDFLTMDAELIKLVDPLRMGVQRGFNGATYDDLRIGNNNDFDGWYYVDLVSDGFLSEAIDTLGFSEFKLEFDLTVGAGATNLHVYPSTLIPVRG